MGRLCNQPQITKASQCKQAFFKFCMSSMRILNLDNKTDRWVTKSKLATKI